MSEYREIINFEGYVVSDDGKVRALDRFICHPRSENKKQFVKGRELKKQHDKDGYETVGLHKNGKLYTKRVHRLVAEAFIPNPEKYPMINHLNSKRDDNRCENIEWTDNSGNQKHAFQIGNRSTFGEKHTHNKLRETDVWTILCRVLNGESQRSVSLDYGLSAGMVNNIMRGKAWPKTLEQILPEIIRIAIEITKQFPCRENSIVVTKLDEALLWLGKRKADREKRGVEGTNVK